MHMRCIRVVDRLYWHTPSLPGGSAMKRRAGVTGLLALPLAAGPATAQRAAAEQRAVAPHVIRLPWIVVKGPMSRNIMICYNNI